MKKPIIVVGALLLLCCAVCAYLVLSLPGGPKSSTVAEQSLDTAYGKVAALKAAGLSPGDPEYDEAQRALEAEAADLASALSIEREADEQNGLVTKISIASGAAGALLILGGILLPRTGRRR